MILLITSCQTLKIDQKNLSKIDKRHPELIDQICASKYNNTDSVREIIKYLPGQVIFDTNLVYINCDSIIKAKDTTKKVNTKKIPCPPNTHKTDTLLKDRFVYTSNDAQERVLIKSKDSLNNIVIVTQTKLKTANKAIRIIIGLISIGLLGLLIKIIYFK
jgi:hypothetical protein